MMNGPLLELGSRLGGDLGANFVMSFSSTFPGIPLVFSQATSFTTWPGMDGRLVCAEHPFHALLFQSPLLHITLEHDGGSAHDQAETAPQAPSTH